jgi:hypothetical protein
VDVNDGGVSGVALPGLIEFAPEDTPRCVEKPGTASLPREVGLSLLRRVYGFAPTLPIGKWRTEFSIHPLSRGFRHEHTILWELEHDESETTGVRIVWPHRFSRFIGDKAFGLLIADVLGWAVPATTVISRPIAPFTFGRPTGTGEVWIRTCPREATPGRFTTHRGWLDPFRLLESEDPGGTEIASICSQESVSSEFSGAVLGAQSGQALVEGVKGTGAEFMMGAKRAETLPIHVRDAVSSFHQKVARVLGEGSKVEWAYADGEIWVLQLQLVNPAISSLVIVPGDATIFRSFDVRRGLDQLRDLIESVQGTGEGITLEGDVGITSHFGDVLRRARIPSVIRPEETPNPTRA